MTAPHPACPVCTNPRLDPQRWRAPKPRKQALDMVFVVQAMRLEMVKGLLP